MNRSPLKVLLVEDSENDALLLQLELERAGYEVSSRRVQTAEEMLSSLQQQTWDLIIADYVMPRFNGLAALGLVKELGLDLPFIIVSGHISDDTAVAAMKAGAHDYVMKDNLARLGSAVQRELREAEVRRERRGSEVRLKAESAFREAIEKSIPSGIATVDLEGKQTYVNPAFCAMVRWTEDQLIGTQPPFRYWPPEELERITEAMSKVIQGQVPPGGFELRYLRSDNERLDVLVQVTPLADTFGNVTGWVSSASDITERKRAERRLAAEHAITRILANSPTLVEAGPGIIEVLLDSLEVDFGELWVTDAKGQSLQPAVILARRPAPELDQFARESQALKFPAGASLPGRVWQERRVAWITELEADAQFERHQPAAKAGFRSGLAFPIQSGEEFFGVLEFFNQRPMAENETLLNMMSAIGSEIGQFIKRRHAEEELRRAHDHLETRVLARTADLKTANARLQTAISERKKLEHELLDITEKERRRIGLDLHDDLGQKLSGIALMTKGLQLRLAKQKADEAQEASKIHKLVQQAMSHASDLAQWDPLESTCRHASLSIL